jgi:hypothetical protein
MPLLLLRPGLGDYGAFILSPLSSLWAADQTLHRSPIDRSIASNGHVTYHLGHRPQLTIKRHKTALLTVTLCFFPLVS